MSPKLLQIQSQGIMVFFLWGSKDSRDRYRDPRRSRGLPYPTRRSHNFENNNFFMRCKPHVLRLVKLFVKTSFASRKSKIIIFKIYF